MSVYQLLTIVVLFFYFSLSLSSLLWLMNVPGWLTICCDTYRRRFYQNMVMKPLSKTGYIELDFSNILLKLCEMLSFEWSNFFFFFNAIFAAFFFFFFFLFCQYIVCAWCKWLKNDCYPPLSQTRTSKKFSFLNQKLIIYKKILQALCLLLAVFIMRLDVSLRQQPVSWSALTQGLYTTSRLHNYLQRFHSLHFNPF